MYWGNFTTSGWLVTGCRRASSTHNSGTPRSIDVLRFVPTLLSAPLASPIFHSPHLSAHHKTPSQTLSVATPARRGRSSEPAPASRNPDVSLTLCAGLRADLQAMLTTSGWASSESLTTSCAASKPSCRTRAWPSPRLWDWQRPWKTITRAPRRHRGQWGPADLTGA